MTNKDKKQIYAILLWQYDESIVWIYDNKEEATKILNKLSIEGKYVQISEFYLNENLYNY